MADSTVGKEFCLNGIPVKDLLATKSTFSRQEIRWMVDTLENCKVGPYLLATCGPLSRLLLFGDLLRPS